MDSQIESRLTTLETKIDEVAVTTRKLYKIFLWTGIITVAAIVLPLIFAVFALPSIISGISGVTDSYGNLGL